jgi:hypothetical protein
MSLGQLIDQRQALRVRMSLLNKEVDDLKTEADALEAQIKSTMINQGLTVAAGETARVTLSEEVNPTVENWDELYQYIKDNNAFYLLQRRVAATAFRETLQADTVVPGVRGVTTHKLAINQR